MEDQFFEPKKQVSARDKTGGGLLLFLGFVYLMFGGLVSVSARTWFDYIFGIPLALLPGVAVMYLGMETRSGRRKSYTYALVLVLTFAPFAIVALLDYLNIYGT